MQERSYQSEGFVRVLIRRAGSKAKRKQLSISAMKKCLLVALLLVCLGLLHIIASSVAAHGTLSKARSAPWTSHEVESAAVHFLANEPTFQFSGTDFTVDEGGNFATITVTRSGDSSVSASVDYSSTDGTAYTIRSWGKDGIDC